MVDRANRKGTQTRIPPELARRAAQAIKKDVARIKPMPIESKRFQGRTIDSSQNITRSQHVSLLPTPKQPFVPVRALQRCLARL